MANVLTYKGSGVVQIMSTVELEALSQAVLENMAQNNGPGGIYTSNVGNPSYTLIGTFTDTQFAGNIGDGNVTIISSEYPLYQDLTTPTGTDAPRALTYTSSTTPMGEANDTELNEIADSILSYCVNSEGPHSYVLASSAPVDGGTWTSLGTLLDTYSGGINTPKNLYKKLTAGVYDLKRPLKYGGSGVLQEFSDTEISNISKRVRQRIVDTGIGQYLLQATTPTPGTWVSKGTVTDTRATEVTGVVYTQSEYTSHYTSDVPYTLDNIYNTAYTLTYSGDYYTTADLFYTSTLLYESVYYTKDQYYDVFFTGVVPAAYTGVANTYFSGLVPAVYTGSVTNFYTGYYTGPNNQFFTGVVPATYTGLTNTYFTGFVPAVYTGSVTNFYTGSYTGPLTQYFTGTTPINYTADYTGAYTGSFANNPNYQGIYYISSYQSFVPAAGFWTFYEDLGDGTQYTGTGPLPGQFSVFVGSPAVNYTGPTPPTYYLGPGPGPIPVAPYTNQPPGYFAAPFPAIGVFYTGLSFGTTYTKDAVNYTGPIFGPVCYLRELTFQTYLGASLFFDGTFGAPVFTTTFTGTTPVVYTGNFFSNFGTPQFSSVVPAYFAGTAPVAYTGSTFTSFTGTTPVVYTGTFFSNFGTPQFSSVAPTYFTGTAPVVYTGSTFTSFTGTTPVQYQTYYTDPGTPYTITYTLDSTIYTNDSFYTGPAIAFNLYYDTDYTSSVYYTGDGPVYDTGYIGDYTGSSISDTPVTITTLTLWRRVA